MESDPRRLALPLRNQTPEQIAEAFGLKASLVRKLARTGKIPANKIGGLWRFNLAEVQAATDYANRKQIDRRS